MPEKFNVKSEILRAVAEANDPIQRAHLMLVLGVLEYIEDLVNDDLSMRAKVLNGHAGNHHDDHDWIGEQRKMGCDQLCIRVKDHLDEADRAKATKKGLLTKFAESMLNQLGTVIITALAVAAGFTFLK